MPSLSQLLATHGNLLVLDAASTQVQVGLLRAGEPGVWHETPGDAGEAIFVLTEKALASASVKIAHIAAFAFCEGPGSMLGVRTVAMALRTWQALLPRPAYSYQSLAIAGRCEWTKQSPRAFALIADARRDTWHHQAVHADGSLAPLARVATADLPTGELLTLENFRSWTPLPDRAVPIPYRLTEIFPEISSGDYFRAVTAPDAFQHEAPEYKKWSAQIHRAATVPQK